MPERPMHNHEVIWASATQAHNNHVPNLAETANMLPRTLGNQIASISTNNRTVAPASRQQSSVTPATPAMQRSLSPVPPMDFDPDFDVEVIAANARQDQEDLTYGSGRSSRQAAKKRAKTKKQSTNVRETSTSINHRKSAPRPRAFANLGEKTKNVRIEAISTIERNWPQFSNEWPSFPMVPRTSDGSPYDVEVCDNKFLENLASLATATSGRMDDAKRLLHEAVTFPARKSDGRLTDVDIARAMHWHEARAGTAPTRPQQLSEAPSTRTDVVWETQPQTARSETRSETPASPAIITRQEPQQDSSIIKPELVPTAQAQAARAHKARMAKRKHDLARILLQVQKAELALFKSSIEVEDADLPVYEVED